MKQGSTLRNLSILGLLGLGLVGPAPADAVFGQGEVQSADSEKKIGFLNVDESEFPAFQNFLWGKEGAQTSAAFGMVYRTHRHLFERQRAQVKQFAGISTQHALGAYDDVIEPGEEDETRLPQAALMSVVIKDAEDLYRSYSFYQEPADLIEQIARRLRGVDIRQLSFCIESEKSERRRFLFVYSARKVMSDDVAEKARGMTDAQLDGYEVTATPDSYRRKGIWVCRFYDPHVSTNSSHRFGVLYLDMDIGEIRVSSSWASISTTEGDGEDRLASGDGNAWGFASVNPAKIGVADLNHWFQSRVAEYDEASSAEVSLPAQVTRFLENVNYYLDLARSGEQSWIDFGAHDAARHTNPGGSAD